MMNWFWKQFRATRLKTCCGGQRVIVRNSTQDQKLLSVFCVRRERLLFNTRELKQLTFLRHGTIFVIQAVLKRQLFKRGHSQLRNMWFFTTKVRSLRRIQIYWNRVLLEFLYPRTSWARRCVKGWQSAYIKCWILHLNDNNCLILLTQTTFLAGLLYIRNNYLRHCLKALWCIRFIREPSHSNSKMSCFLEY